MGKPRYQPFSTGSHRRNYSIIGVKTGRDASILGTCAEWLSSIGKNDLSDYLASTAVPKTSMAVNLIEDGLSDSPSLIVIDDFIKLAMILFILSKRANLENANSSLDW